MKVGILCSDKKFLNEKQKTGKPLMGNYSIINEQQYNCFVTLNDKILSKISMSFTW